MSDHHGNYVNLLYWTPPTMAEPDLRGKWEVVFDEDRVMVRVRWTLPTEDGAQFYCRHYKASRWGIYACEREAEEWNALGKTPYSVTHAVHATNVPLILPAAEYRARIARRDAARVAKAVTA